jgi:diguanylate cyclase (GGDEF)-like protein
VANTSYVSLTRVERIKFLRGLAEQLGTALRAEPFSATPGYAIGASMVAADFVSPEALGRTVAIIHHRLLSDLGLTGDDARHRLANLLEALVTGYVRALRDRTLDEQEAIRRAALVARQQAERALRTSEARFRRAALHDPLTGLPNRALFSDRLVQIFTESTASTRLGVCFIDLDGFKAVNDTLGHHVGDLLLVAVADRLGAVGAGSGRLVARVGGDEFVILIEHTTCADDAITVADEALSTLGQPFIVDGHQLSISASIGVVERRIADTDPSEMIRAASITLHWAKADGKARRTLFDADRNQREVARYTLSAAMPYALERDEFTLDYQPLVDLADGTVRGVEALARWIHPTLGLLGADKFIDLAEDNGLIIRLGSRLMEQACGQAAEWQQTSPHPPFVSVNLAVHQIRHAGLVRDVTAVLDRTGLPPHRLQLEITESAVMGNDDATLHTLHALADLGVRLAIDDFGTGYSNLAYLRELPVHGLKLAGPFVRGLRSPDTANPTDETIVTTLVILAHTLGLTVTAECVETAAQAQRLNAIGCDIGQGWYLGRPTHPSHITPLLARV